MIYTLIDKPINLSTDAVFGIIEIYFRGKYKVVSWSDKEMVIKKVYKYKSHGWNPIITQLKSIDWICFKALDNSIRFEVIVWKQILAISVFLIFGFVFSWKIWELSFGVSVLIPLFPVLIAITVKYYEIKKFINREKTEISERISI